MIISIAVISFLLLVQVYLLLKLMGGGKVIKSAIKYAVLMVIFVFIGLWIGYRQGQIDLEYKPSRYDAVVATLEALTGRNSAGERVLLKSIEETAEYFAEGGR
jgi:hypothetical protein